MSEKPPVPGALLVLSQPSIRRFVPGISADALRQRIADFQARKPPSEVHPGMEADFLDKLAVLKETARSLAGTGQPDQAANIYKGILGYMLSHVGADGLNFDSQVEKILEFYNRNKEHFTNDPTSFILRFNVKKLSRKEDDPFLVKEVPIDHKNSPNIFFEIARAVENANASDPYVGACYLLGITCLRVSTDFSNGIYEDEALDYIKRERETAFKSGNLGLIRTHAERVSKPKDVRNTYIGFIAAAELFEHFGMLDDAKEFIIKAMEAREAEVDDYKHGRGSFPPYIVLKALERLRRIYRFAERLGIPENPKTSYSELILKVAKLQLKDFSNLSTKEELKLCQKIIDEDAAREKTPKSLEDTQPIPIINSLPERVAALEAGHAETRSLVEKIFEAVFMVKPPKD